MLDVVKNHKIISHLSYCYYTMIFLEWQYVELLFLSALPQPEMRTAFDRVRAANAKDIDIPA